MTEKNSFYRKVILAIGTASQCLKANFPFQAWTKINLQLTKYNHSKSPHAQGDAHPPTVCHPQPTAGGQRDLQRTDAPKTVYSI